MEKFKQDVFEYVDINMKEDRKFNRKRNIYMSRHDTRFKCGGILKRLCVSSLEVMILKLINMMKL